MFLGRTNEDFQKHQYINTKNQKMVKHSSKIK